MALALFCSRIANKHILSSIRGLPSALRSVQLAHTTSSLSSCPKVEFKPFVEPMHVDHDHRNMDMKRPMSPHLTIYAYQITSFTSITHRATGMVLSGYFIALGCGALVLPHDISHYISMIEGLNLSPATLFVAKFALATPFGYHLANGIRHLVWDTGRALTLKDVYLTGYTMLAASVVISAALAAL